MPLYEYECSRCRVTTDRLVNIEARDSQKCSDCSHELTRKIVFHGAVWAPTSTGGGMKI